MQDKFSKDKCIMHIFDFRIKDIKRWWYFIWAINTTTLLLSDNIKLSDLWHDSKNSNSL